MSCESFDVKERSSTTMATMMKACRLSCDYCKRRAYSFNDCWTDKTTTVNVAEERESEFKPIGKKADQIYLIYKISTNFTVF